MPSYEFFAPCPLHAEELLKRELLENNGDIFDNIKEHPGGLAFSGDLLTYYTANLWSRIADRILLFLGEFPAHNQEDLYKGARKIPWADHFETYNTISCSAHGTTDELRHTGFTARKLKDAVADYFQARNGERPSVDTKDPDIRIEVYVSPGRDRKKPTARFYINPAGEPLSRRGYRSDTKEAPLRENLAAALLYRAGWPDIAKSGGSLIDPLCGSGTLLAEGALMAADIAPGLIRTHKFTHWKGHDEKLWDQLKLLATERIKERAGKVPPVLGFDKENQAIQYAGNNLRRAGLENIVVLKVKPVSAHKPEELNDIPPGLVATNPPYGERLEKQTELGPLYRQLGFFFKEVLPEGWKMSMITSNKNLARDTGLHYEKVNTLINGGIKCGIYHYIKESQINNLEKLSPSGEQFLNRIRKNRKHLGKWTRKNNISCYRIYDADLPDYNAAIDIYEGKWAVIQEYAPPVRIDLEKAERRLKEIQTVISEELEILPVQVFLKRRKRQKGSDQYKKHQAAGRKEKVRENGLQFYVNFTDYLDTGIFLDHRPVRQMIREQAEGKRFLNLFAYTGTATVYAAAGGAKSTETVDASRTYTEWAEDNLKLNKQGGKNHTFIKEDVFTYLKRCQKKFDLIFCDPPTFSNSKSAQTDFDIQTSHAELLTLCWNVLAPGGTLIFSNNFKKFKMEWEAPKQAVVTDITSQSIPRDYERNGKIHVCYRIERK